MNPTKAAQIQVQINESADRIIAAQHDPVALRRLIPAHIALENELADLLLASGSLSRQVFGR